MPLVRTPKGLQWIEPADITPGDVQSTPAIAATGPGAAVVDPGRKSSVFGLVSSKELLPWILAASHVVSWFGVRYLTSDRMQQQQQDDHIAISEIRKQLGEIDKGQSAIAAKVELIVAIRTSKDTSK